MHPSTVSNPSTTMSSLEIAKLTDKRHDHVLRDIRSTLEQAGIDAPKFGGYYLNPQNKARCSVFNLPRAECDLVISGYSVKYRWAIIQRWHELEKQATPSAHTSLVADPYKPYRDAADDCCRVVAQHGRGALVALLTQFDADHLYRVPLARLPEFVAICRKVTGTAVSPAPTSQPKPVALPATTGLHWRNPEEVERFFQAARLRRDEMYQPILITPEQAREVFSDRPRLKQRLENYIGGRAA